jgi:hypothetical protein
MRWGEVGIAGWSESYVRLRGGGELGGRGTGIEVTGYLLARFSCCPLHDPGCIAIRYVRIDSS